MHLPELVELIYSCVEDGQINKVDSKFKEKGFVETVCYIWESVWTNEERQQVENDVRNKNIESNYYKLIFEQFDMKRHFSIVDSHREFIVKAYNRLKEFVPNMSKEDAENHDLSKYDFSQAIGYTAKWVHNVDNDSWKKALDDHYMREPHHPQYFKSERMTPRRFLEESLIDMVACHWERNLKGSEEVTNSELVGFMPQFLNRYREEDAKKIRTMIEMIKDSCDKN